MRLGHEGLYGNARSNTSLSAVLLTATVLTHEGCRIGPISGKRELLGLTMDAGPYRHAAVARSRALMPSARSWITSAVSKRFSSQAVFLNTVVGRVGHASNVEDGHLQLPC